MNAERNSLSFAKWPAVVAIVWFLGFLAFFYSLKPPNNPTYRRYEFWQQVPAEMLTLLDAVDPPQEAEQIPSGWSYFPQRFDLMLTAAVILAGAWAVGHIALRLLRPPLDAQSPERTVFAFAIGLGFESLFTLLCGLAGLLRSELIVAFIVFAVVCESLLRILEWRKAAAMAAGRAAEPMSWRLKRICWSILPLVPFLLAMLLGAMLPSQDFDVREYHLEGPKEFYQAGRIRFLPHNVYTSFPFFTEMLSLLGMTLRGDWFRGALVGKTVLMCFGPLTGLAVYAAARRWFSARAGWIGAVVYLTMPWTFRISTIAYAEGGLTFYLMVSLLACGIGMEKLKAEPVAARRQFLLCGLFAGCAMACKYTGLVSVVIPLLAAIAAAPFVLKIAAENRTRQAAQFAGIFLVGTAITIGPWLLKNLIQTGNPVYPLMYTVFGGADWDAGLNAKWRAGHSPPNYSDLPERLLEVTAGNDWLTPLLYGLAPLSLLLYILRKERSVDGNAKFDAAAAPFQTQQPRRHVGWMWLYAAWLFATWWALTHRIDRFWVPMTPVIAVLAGIGAAAVGEKSWRMVSGAGITAAALFNLAFILSGASGNNTFLFDLQRAQQPPPGIALLNRSLPDNARVLLVGEAQVFDAEFPLVYNTVFDYSIFEKWLAADAPGVPAEELPLRGAEAIRSTLREHRITHVFVNWSEVHRYRSTYGYTKFVTPARFDSLVERGLLKPPNSMAVVLDNGLADLVAAEESRAPSFQTALPDGEVLTVYSVRREFGDAERRLIEPWGGRLFVDAEGRKLFVTGQLYEVSR